MENIKEMFQGELAALQAYSKALQAPELSSKDVQRLRKIYENHEQAAKFWQRQSVETGKGVENSSGGWGVIVGHLLSVTKRLNLRATVTGLIAGEKMGRSRYAYLLSQDKIPEGIKHRIREQFIPNQSDHIQTLKGLVHVHESYKKAN